MFIKGQDDNTIFTLSDKGINKGVVYTEDIYINNKYYGSNIFGRTLFHTYLLGTYEEDESDQVVAEIYKLLKSGAQYYSMPQPSIDILEATI